jgi:tetratricopeptide (TPR) repeat protein
MRSLLYRSLILLAAIGLVAIPPVLTGYAELKEAQSETDGVQKAFHFERAARFLPWRKDLWASAGEEMYVSGNFSSSISYLEKAREANVLSGFGWDILAHSYWKLGEHETAIEVWESGIETHPQYFEIYSRLGMAYREKGDFESERTAIEKWLEHEDEARVYLDHLGTTSAPFHYRFGQLLAVSNPDRALDEFMLAASLDPEYDSVVETMRTALNLASLETDESAKSVVIGRGLGLVNEWPLAANAFYKAVAADGENAEAWAWLGEAKQQLGQGGRAELDQALLLGRTSPVVLGLRGVYWTRQGRGDQALAEYLLAAEYDPENPARQISIGDAYAMRGDLQAGLAAYLRATEMDPTDADLWRLMAEFSARYNMQVDDVGLPAAQKAVDLSGEDPLALDALGWALALLERYDEAQEVLEQAIQLDPDLSSAHLHLGIIAMQRDDWEAAQERFLKARDLDPEGPAGAQARVLLDQYFP